MKVFSNSIQFNFITFSRFLHQHQEIRRHEVGWSLLIEMHSQNILNIYGLIGESQWLIKPNTRDEVVGYDGNIIFFRKRE